MNPLPKLLLLHPGPHNVLATLLLVVTATRQRRALQKRGGATRTAGVKVQLVGGVVWRCGLIGVAFVQGRRKSLGAVAMLGLKQNMRNSIQSPLEYIRPIL